ncbi:MAG TPA: hypothetical protein VED01_09270 [Burkholderiales bacterium]|nr:hypothetical protein [Burkholderiales bacterium]
MLSLRAAIERRAGCRPIVRDFVLGRWLAAVFAALALNGCAVQAHDIRPQIERTLVQVEVFDRTRGTTLPVYSKDGRRYVVGTPGNEYALRIRNRTGARVLVVTSVDGVNVISGDTASPSQSGYVLDPWGSVEILGWRKSLERSAAFYFTEHQNSYAARTGRPDNVGVIGVAVFRERSRPVAHPVPQPRIAPFDSGSAERREAPAPAESPAPSAQGGLADRQEARRDAARAASKLGTGHGRDEASHVRVVRFERASDTPAETIAIQYDRRENLAALGVLPAAPHYTRREPEPFPGALRFVPDPR